MVKKKFLEMQLRNFLSNSNSNTDITTSPSGQHMHVRGERVLSYCGGIEGDCC